MFANYHHHITALQHGFLQRIKQANYQYEYHTKQWQAVKDSQGIHNMFQHPMEYTVSQSDQQHTPVNTPLPRNALTSNDPKQTPLQQIHHLPRDRLKASHPVSDRMTGLLTHQVNPFNQVPSLSAIKYHL